jgi:hypothetical protein
MDWSSGVSPTTLARPASAGAECSSSGCLSVDLVTTGCAQPGRRSSASSARWNSSVSQSLLPVLISIASILQLDVALSGSKMHVAVSVWFASGLCIQAHGTDNPHPGQHPDMRLALTLQPRRAVKLQGCQLNGHRAVLMIGPCSDTAPPHSGTPPTSTDTPSVPQAATV